jgi:hypothetical protein
MSRIRDSFAALDAWVNVESDEFSSPAGDPPTVPQHAIGR